MGELTEWIAVPLLVNASNRFSPSCIKGQKTDVVKEKARERSLKSAFGTKRNLLPEIVSKLQPRVMNFNNHISNNER